MSAHNKGISYLWMWFINALAVVTGNQNLPEEFRRRELSSDLKSNRYFADPDICPYDEIRDLEMLREMHDEHWFV